jgi:SusD/RagB-like outer membrane lipoprotein
MKNLFKLFTFLLITLFLSNCTEKFDEINTNPKALTLASLDAASYGFVVRKAIQGPSYYYAGNGMQLLHSLYFDTYSNMWASTHPNFLSDRYVMVGSWLNGAFNSFYSGQSPQIKYAEDFARQEGLDPEKAMMKIWKVFIYNRYTDVLGPIPYTEYGNMEKTVPYDTQESIYENFFLDLDSAVTILKANAGGTSSILSKYDPIYSGNLDQWQKFASSLRLRLALRIKYVQPAIAQAQAEKALSEGVIMENADNGWVATDATFSNPYNRISSWGEYRMSADAESIYKGYLDPRVQNNYSPAAIPDPTDDPAGVEFPYEGMRNGQTKSDRQGINFNKLCSDMSAPYIVLGGAGPDWFVIRAFESYLERAEGALEGWNMGGTAADLYQMGIQKSLDENGYADENLAGDVYSTSTLVPASPGGAPIVDDVLGDIFSTVQEAPASTIPIAWASATTDEEHLEQIITQKWIGLFPDSQEAYADRRRTHYPKLYDRMGSENPNVPVTSLPVRLTYWSTEYTNNNAAVLDAITKLNAESSTPNGDLSTTKLWWDKKP